MQAAPRAPAVTLWLLNEPSVSPGERFACRDCLRTVGVAQNQTGHTRVVRLGGQPLVIRSEVEPRFMRSRRRSSLPRSCGSVPRPNRPMAQVHTKGNPDPSRRPLLPRSDTVSQQLGEYSQKQGATPGSERRGFTWPSTPGAPGGVEQATVSIGGALLGGKNIDARSLSEGAEQALQKAKALGKNRVVFYEPEQPS